MKNGKIVMLAGEGESTNIVYNALTAKFSIDKVIMEEPVPRSQFLKSRVKRLGLVKVLCQLLFKVSIIPLLKRRSQRRILEIKRSYGLFDEPVKQCDLVRVRSVNDQETLALLRQLNPEVVVVNGTRIISKRLLESIPARFVNMHAGITPLYRGVHGAYWSLVDGRKESCGVTVHLVDPGIDTGNILHQGLVVPSDADNFITYPYLQLASGIPLLVKSVGEIVNGMLQVKDPPEGASKLWSHPGFFEYIWYRFSHGIK